MVRTFVFFRRGAGHKLDRSTRHHRAGSSRVRGHFRLASALTATRSSDHAPEGPSQALRCWIWRVRAGTDHQNTRIIDYAGQLVRNDASEAREERYLAEGCIWVFESTASGVGRRRRRQRCAVHQPLRRNCCWFEVVGWTSGSRSRAIRAGESSRLRDCRKAHHTLPLPPRLQEQTLGSRA
jgi:hypothetical protein